MGPEVRKVWGHRAARLLQAQGREGGLLARPRCNSRKGFPGLLTKGSRSQDWDSVGENKREKGGLAVERRGSESWGGGRAGQQFGVGNHGVRWVPRRAGRRTWKLATGSEGWPGCHQGPSVRIRMTTPGFPKDPQSPPQGHPVPEGPPGLRRGPGREGGDSHSQGPIKQWPPRTLKIAQLVPGPERLPRAGRGLACPEREKLVPCPGPPVSHLPLTPTPSPVLQAAGPSRQGPGHTPRSQRTASSLGMENVSGVTAGERGLGVAG